MGARIYTLSDGSQWTAASLAGELDLDVTTARSRLNSSENPEVVLAPKGSRNGVIKGKSKAFSLSDGSELTTAELSEKFGIPKGAISNRLSRGIRDIERLSKPVGVHATEFRPGKDLEESMNKRNFNDEMSRLILKTI